MSEELQERRLEEMCTSAVTAAAAEEAAAAVGALQRKVEAQQHQVQGHVAYKLVAAPAAPAALLQEIDHQKSKLCFSCKA